MHNILLALLNDAIELSYVENPAVATVVIAWLIASKSFIPANTKDIAHKNVRNKYILPIAQDICAVLVLFYQTFQMIPF